MDVTEIFLDTNILLYLLSDDTAKADRAEELIAAGGIISIQVLNEFASVVSRKLRMPWSEIREILDTVRRLCQVEPILVETHDRGLALAQRYGFSVYDSMILASALLADSKILYSEDLHHGQRIDGQITVVTIPTTVSADATLT